MQCAGEKSSSASLATTLDRAGADFACVRHVSIIVVRIVCL